MISRFQIAIGFLCCLIVVSLLPWSVYAQAPTTFQYVYDSLNQLSRVIDSEGNVLTYKYDEVGNLLSIERSTLAELGPPVVTSVDPPQVNQDDPATVRLIGTGLLGGEVTTSHPGITINAAFGDDEELMVDMDVSPTAQLGTAPLNVTTIVGSTIVNLTVIEPRPRITSITPEQGPSTGNTMVTIAGSHFTAETTVNIGGNFATDIVFVNSTTLTAKTPIGPSEQPPISVDVTVTNPMVGSDTLENGFLYIFGLEYGDIVSGSIDPTGDEDIYAFNGVIGDTILLRLHRTSGPWDPQLRVFLPDGTLVPECSTDVVATSFVEVQCTLTSGQAHTLIISDPGGNETGDYDLTLQRLNNPVNPVPLAYGEIISGTINPSVEVDPIVFTGAAGDTVMLRLSRQTGSWDPQFRVFLPDGTAVPDCSTDVVATSFVEVQCTLTSGQAHTLIISDPGGNETGDYDLTLQRLNSPVNPVPLAYGEIISGTINPSVEVDPIVFTGAAGDTVMLRLSRQTGSWDPQFRVFLPDGTAVPDCSTDVVATSFVEVQCTLTSGQAHTLIISDPGGNETGDYDLTLQRLNSPVNPVPLAYGEIISGTINPSVEVDPIVFTGAAGDTVMLRLSRQTGSWDPQFRVFLPDGTAVPDCSTDVVATSFVEVQCTLTSGQAHTLIISDPGGNETGDYDLTLQRLNSPVNPVPLAYGEIISGTINPSVEVDPIVFTGAAGDTVMLRLSRQTGSWDPQFRVFLPDGTAVPDCSTDVVATSFVEVQCTLTSGQAHTLIISDPGGNETGDYDLTLQRLNSPVNPVPLAYGEIISGTINPSVEVDPIVFTGAAGDTVMLRLSRQTGSWDPQFRVFLPDGTAVPDCSTDVVVTSFVEVQCTLTSGQAHTLIISDPGGNETGDYDLTLQRLNNPVNSVIINFGDSVSGSIDPTVELDAYTFSGTSGDEISITMTRTSGNLDPQIRTYQSDGTNIPDCSSVTGSSVLTVSCTLTVMGDHAILVSDSGGNETGNYDLMLELLNASSLTGEATSGVLTQESSSSPESIQASGTSNLLGEKEIESETTGSISIHGGIPKKTFSGRELQQVINVLSINGLPIETARKRRIRIPQSALAETSTLSIEIEAHDVPLDAPVKLYIYSKQRKNRLVEIIQLEGSPDHAKAVVSITLPSNFVPTHLRVILDLPSEQRLR